VRGRLAALILVGGVLLAACAPSAVVRVGRQIGASLYLPTALPQGLRLETVRQIGRHMAALTYRGQQGSLTVFESPEPIALPPGAEQDKHGVWQATAAVNGGTLRTALLHLQGEFVEVMAFGMAAPGFAQLLHHWRRITP